ncbi:Importin subunit alpha-4 [Thelohanellus kitauei]|uniref:Importin subunit alpha-4 n=1 Tax=Thelohanellus kitauei TaxID=669202 RepID=A0A0C2MVK5_THEKT|nr:Importin subunit alpha-4 [Thelohanellus kitauei]
MKKLSWMLINICCKKDEDVPIEYVPQIIRLLNVLIVHKDEYILADVLSALFCLTDSSCDHVSLIIASGMVDKIYTFLEASEKLILKALSVLCNIAGSTDEHIQYLLDNGIIIHIRPLLMTKNEKIKQVNFHLSRKYIGYFPTLPLEHVLKCWFKRLNNLDFVLFEYFSPNYTRS